MENKLEQYRRLLDENRITLEEYLKLVDKEEDLVPAGLDYIEEDFDE